MDSYFNKFRKNILIKVSSLNAVGVLIKLFTGIISSKVIAIVLGSEGMALIGNLRNFITSIQSIATLGLSNGIIKYISEYKEDDKKLSSLFSSVFYCTVFATILSSLFLYVKSEFLNSLIFGEEFDFQYVFKTLALALPFFSANMLCLAIINGFSKYKTVITINIIGSILGLIVVLILILQYGLKGAFFAIIIVPAISFLITIGIMIKQNNELKLLKIKKPSSDHLGKLFTYSIMALITAILVPSIQIHIRNQIIDVSNIVDAGYWEGMLRMSNYYMLFFTSLFTLYLLPKLASIHTKQGYRNEILNFYKTILPIFGVALFVLYLVKYWIVLVFLSEEFLPMLPIFKWHFAGDFLKVASLVISYQFLAKKMFWHYVFTEITSIVFLYFSSIYLIEKHGFVGASMAHFYNYIFYYLLLIIVLRKTLFSKTDAI